MTTFEEFWPTVAPIVAQVAGEYGARHRVHGADADDFRQELTLWLLDNEATVSDWYEDLSPQSFEKMVAKSLRNESTDYGLDVKAQALGYKRDDLYFYGKNELKALLPSVFDPQKWHEPPQSEGRSTKSAAEGGNWVCTLADVSRAYKSLSAEDRDVLAAIHRDEYTNKLLAETRGTTEALMSYYHDRAINRLLKALGGQKPDPMREQETKQDVWRGRRAIANSHAQAMTGADYE